MSKQSLETIFATAPPKGGFWDGAYKIPWNDPEFSARMLEIHLSQETDLASRKADTIGQQARWLCRHALAGKPSSVLDLGCGPGLYASHFAEGGNAYRGIDFSPASIAHAKKHNQHPEACTFMEGDVRTTVFGDGYDLVMMLYGELDVFSPDQCRSLLRKAADALPAGGKIALEVHTVDAVREAGTLLSSWSKAESGLFSLQPYICLQENHWNEEHAVAIQFFHVLDVMSGETSTMRSTTKAWTNKEYEEMLMQAGFTEMREHEDWPRSSEHFKLLTATKH